MVLDSNHTDVIYYAVSDAGPPCNWWASSASGVVMPVPKPAHYQGSYHVRARRVREAAYADPSTRCWRCRLRLHECKPHRNGKPATWTAGHLRDSDPTSPLLPECSSCNKSAGAAYGNRLRGARRAAWKAAGATQTHTSTRW